MLKILLAAVTWAVRLQLSGGGGGGGSSTQTVQNYSPEEVARRTALMDEADRLYRASGPLWQTYPGSAPLTPSQSTLDAENYLLGLVNTQKGDAASLSKAVNYGLTDAMDVNNNPYLQSAITAAINPITQSYTDPGGVMSQIRQGAVQAGGVGGSRQGIAEGLAAGRYAQAIGDTTSSMLNKAYETGQDTMTKTLALAPQALQSAQLPAQTLAAVGASQEGRDLDQAAYAEQQRLWELNAPWQNLQNYANMVFGGGSSGSTSVASAGSRPSTLMSALSGAASGQSIAQLIAGGSGWAGGPVGWGLTALGALASL